LAWSGKALTRCGNAAKRDGVYRVAGDLEGQESHSSLIRESGGESGQRVRNVRGDMTADEQAILTLRRYANHDGTLRSLISQAITVAVAAMQERCVKVADEHDCREFPLGSMQLRCYCPDLIAADISKVKP